MTRSVVRRCYARVRTLRFLEQCGRQSKLIEKEILTDKSTKDRLKLGTTVPTMMVERHPRVIARTSHSHPCGTRKSRDRAS